MNVLSSLAVLALLIIFHEAGHFFAAKFQGIKVTGFSIGFGPAILKKESEGVTYALRALPLGGFVSFPDDDQDSDISSEDPNLLKNRPVWQKAIVISAGVLANLLVAWVVVFGQAALVGLPNNPEPGVVVVSVQAGNVAASAGLEAGDRILSVDGVRLGKGQEAVQNLVRQIQDSPGQVIELESIKKEELKHIQIIPDEKLGNGRIGAQLQANVSKELRPAKNIGEVLVHTDTQFLDLLNRTIKGYQSLFTDFAQTSQQLSGPVKIIEIGAQLSEQGGGGLVLFAALVSINLAVLNSLPLPLLDGGQLALVLFEALRGKPIPEKLKLVFLQSGLLLLVGLSVVLVVRDTSQLSIVQQFISH